VTAFLAPLEVSARGKGPARPTQRPALLFITGNARSKKKTVKT
jgi:hypothetical protein